MNFRTMNLGGQAADDATQFSSDVKDLLVQLLPLLGGHRVAIGLDALLSAYITTVSQHSVAGGNQHAAICLRKAADMLEAGAFDQSSTPAGNAVH